MFAYRHRGAHPRPEASQSGVRRRRLAAVLGVASASLLASAATIPAAFAREVPPPGGSYARPSVAPATHTVHASSTIGLEIWQIVLIAVCAALIAAIVSVTLDQARARRPAFPATAASSARPVRVAVRTAPLPADSPGVPAASR